MSRRETLRRLGESGLLERIRRKAGRTPSHLIQMGRPGRAAIRRRAFCRPRRGYTPAILGIGDDAAVLPYNSKEVLLFTTDCCVDGVDFRIGRDRPELIGRKTLAQNLSDIAAMGGDPTFAVLALGLPARLDPRFIGRFYRGLLKMADEFGVSLVGGDLSRSPVFFASLTLLGRAERAHWVSRGGARPGDYLFVTGSLGGSILGKHFSFTPRLREGRFLTRHFKVRAMMDISDGLTEDLGKMCRASRTGARLFSERIPVSPAARLSARRRGLEPIRAALTDGEDFELLFALSPREAVKLLRPEARAAGTPVHWIGRMTSGRKIVFSKNERELKEWTWKWRGYRHF